MKALCVNAERKIELREIPDQTTAPSGHLLVEVDSFAINHGDKAFLARPDLLPGLPPRRFDVWGASAAGRVIVVGEGVDQRYLGHQVAIYFSLSRSAEAMGLWAEKVIVTPNACVLLPDSVRARDYCGSLVNIFTAYSFLDEVRDAGHKGVIVTAGRSGTGRALLALARERGVPTLFLARSRESQEELKRLGAEHVLSTEDESFERDFAELSQRLEATAIFDGVGGALVGRLAPIVPSNSSFYFVGFLGGPTPIAVPTLYFMTKNLKMQRFSNFDSTTAKDLTRRAAALQDLERYVADPLFHTTIGQEFGLTDSEAALRYEGPSGAKAVVIMRS